MLQHHEGPLHGPQVQLSIDNPDPEHLRTLILISPNEAVCSIVVIAGKYVDLIEDVLEVVDAASSQMKRSPYAIFVFVETQANAKPILTNMEALPPLVAIKNSSKEKDNFYFRHDLSISLDCF